MTNKIQRIQKYRDLLNTESGLKQLQKDYWLDLNSHLNYLREIEIKLLTNVPLDRDNKVFCNTLERILKQ